LLGEPNKRLFCQWVDLLYLSPNPISKSISIKYTTMALPELTYSIRSPHIGPYVYQKQNFTQFW
jgi:hypothetical protein